MQTRWRRRKWFAFLATGVASILIGACAQASRTAASPSLQCSNAADQQANAAVLEGFFSVIHGDPRMSSDGPSYRFFLMRADGSNIELQVECIASPANELTRFDRARVRIAGNWTRRDTVLMAHAIDSIAPAGTSR